jgi:hypothetical protein
VDCEVDCDPDVLDELEPDPLPEFELFELELVLEDELEDELDEEPEVDERGARTVAGVVAERLWLDDATRLETVPLELKDVRPDVLCAGVAAPELVVLWI